MAGIGEVFRTLNELKHEGILTQYAVAGAMAFLFYTEPARTYDLDIFVFLPEQSGVIFSMEPLYKVLRDRGYSFDAEHVMISDTPVQFLPTYNLLAEEAVEQAIIHDYDGVEVRVISPEHLVALAYQTGGRHRITRAEALEADGILDVAKLNSICAKYGIVRSR